MVKLSLHEWCEGTININNYHATDRLFEAPNKNKNSEIKQTNKKITIISIFIQNIERCCWIQHLRWNERKYYYDIWIVIWKNNNIYLN